MHPPPSLGPRSTVDAVADSLRIDIVSGIIPAGGVLKQNDIAARFGVSIVPVREAFGRLIADGLVTQQTNRGITVREMSERDFLDISEMRLLLEPAALERSMPRLSAEDVQAARDALAGGDRDRTPLDRASAHWDFHRILYSRCDRPRLLQSIGSLHLGITRYWLPVWSRSGMSQDWVSKHEEIVAAVQRQNRKAARRLIEQQIVDSQQRMLSALREERGG